MYLLEWPRRGSSNEYPQSKFLSRNKKNNVHPCKPQFYNIKVDFKGGAKVYRHVIVMERLAEELLISTHNSCFCEEIKKNII